MPNRIAAPLHPVQAWRAFVRLVDARADTAAAAAGLTVEQLPSGVRRHRDPRLDQLAARRAQLTEVDNPYTVVRSVEAGAWSTPTLTVSAGRSAMTRSPVPPAGPAAPANRIPVRLRRADPPAGAGAVPPPTVPPPGRSGCASASLRDHLAVALDPGHPAAAVSGAPAGSREVHAPARPGTGPRSPG
jgi:hypothetical protein